MTIQQLQHIIDISGTYEGNDQNQEEQFDEDIYYPLLHAIENIEKPIIDHLMQCTPEELFYIDKYLQHITKNNDYPEVITLHKKISKGMKHIRKVLKALQKQYEEVVVGGLVIEDDEHEYYHFDFTPSMISGIRLTPKQIELWEKIIDDKFQQLKTEGKYDDIEIM
jgi:hypothetical protein